MNNEKERQKWLFNEKGNVLVENKGGTVPMKNKFNPFAWLFKENPFYIAAFFLPAVILFVAYAVFNVFPFGERSVLVLDLNGQYVYYFDYIHDVLRGSESLFYSWSRSLSGEFFGILGYYLASPFNFIVWLFPREYITEGIMTMLLVKVGAIGVTMAVYLRRGRGLSAGTSLIFSMMYALSAFVITQTMNPMWLDGVLALPLIIFGVEALVKHGRFRLLILALLYSFVTCFYIGYMLGIFTALYFICYLISSRASSEFDVSAVMARIGLFAISAATAVLMASFMLIPVYNSLQLGKSEFTAPFEQEGFWQQVNFALSDLGMKLFPNTYDTVNISGLPAIYSGLLAVILLPLFFLGGKENIISLKKRIAGAVLLLAVILAMYSTPIDTVMHGFQIPNWLPYRYSFILSFLLIAFAAEIFDKLQEFPRRAIAASAIGLFLLMLFYEGREFFSSATVLVPAVIILAFLTGILVSRKNSKLGRNAFCFMVGVVVVFELFYNTYASIEKQNEDVHYSDRATYFDFILPLREKVSEIKAADGGFYRIEKDFHRTVNDPLAVGMYGLSHSASTFNERATTLLGRLGLTSQGFNTRYSGATPLINDLFGIRYIISRDARGELTAALNENALPLAYLTSTALASYDFALHPFDEVDFFKRQSRILSAMLGERGVTDYFLLINKENIQKTTENINEAVTTDGHYAYISPEGTGASRVTYTMRAEADGELFMWLPTAHQRHATVTLNRLNDDGDILANNWLGGLFEADNYHIMSLGEFREGELFSVVLTLTKDDLYYRDSFFAYINTEAYNAAIAELHTINEQTVVTKRSSTELRIETFADIERLLLITIPAEPGWTVTVDGRETQPVEVLDALMGVILPAGTRVVELKFTPGGYPVALILTGAGVLIFAVLCLLYMKLKKEIVALEGVQAAIENEQLTFDGLEFDFNSVEENPIIEEEENEEEEDESEDEIILGSDESYESIIADFSAINEQLIIEEEQLTVDDEQFIIEEEQLTIDDEIEQEIEFEQHDEPEPIIEPVPEPEPAEPVIDFAARRKALELEIETDERLTVEEEAEPEREMQPEPEDEFPQIDFAARRKALELELLRQRNELEQSYSGDVADVHEEEYIYDKVTPFGEPEEQLTIDNEQLTMDEETTPDAGDDDSVVLQEEETEPAVPQEEEKPVFTFDEDIDDLLLNDDEPLEMEDIPVVSQPEIQSEREMQPEPKILPLIEPEYDPFAASDVFQEFEFIMADETDFVGTFEEEIIPETPDDNNALPPHFGTL